jgi:hypothetical protein
VKNETRQKLVEVQNEIKIGTLDHLRELLEGPNPTIGEVSRVLSQDLQMIKAIGKYLRFHEYKDSSWSRDAEGIRRPITFGAKARE